MSTVLTALGAVMGCLVAMSVAGTVFVPLAGSPGHVIISAATGFCLAIGGGWVGHEFYWWWRDGMDIQDAFDDLAMCTFHPAGTSFPCHASPDANIHQPMSQCSYTTMGVECPSGYPHHSFQNA